MNWSNCNVLITGGASFIGTNLIRKLVELGTNITVIDNLTTGKFENIQSYINAQSIKFLQEDILQTDDLIGIIKGNDFVFHLAAVHGGRGYIEQNESDCSRNFSIDSLVINASYLAGVKKLIFASSGCVYPLSLQQNAYQATTLNEKMVCPPYDADGIYGWAKLMAELTLKSFYKEKNFKSVSCRFFTAYGPYATESHAVMALIAKAYIAQDPFEIWGNGSQIRNWTYVDDIIAGLILAAEKIEDGTAINIGNNVGISLTETAIIINELFNHCPKYKYLNNNPTGPLNRVADISMSKKILGWMPFTSFEVGITKTIDWYKKIKTKTEAKELLINNNYNP